MYNKLKAYWIKMTTESNRQAILIMAHHNWFQLEKLVRYFDHKDVDIFLHIDKKSADFNAKYFKELNQNRNVYLLKRRDIHWGTYDQISCELCLYKQSFNFGTYKYFHLLSGDDIPLLPLNDFLDFFRKSNENFIVADDEPRFEIRLQLYHNLLNHVPIPISIKNILNRKLNAIQLKAGINRLKNLKRVFPKIRHGHNWCSLTSEAVELLIENERIIKKYFCFTQCSDEQYKQTILSNSPLADTISGSEIREIDWTKGGAHPKIFTINDLDRLRKAAAEGKVFARKFDENVDNEIIETLYSTF